MNVFLTIDTELSAGLHVRGASLADNIAVSLLGRCEAGEYGALWQARQFERCGLTTTFFVDPMPALVYGTDFLKPLVQDLLDRGQEVQLHLHPEWLEFADAPPVPPRGRSHADYSEDEQERLIACAIDLLTEAGAPFPTAFRAGNFAAEDATLRALARNGIGIDTSFNPAFSGDDCRISFDPSQVEPAAHQGVIEYPVSCIREWPRGLRPGQLCALSGQEMEAALRHGVAAGQSAFTIVSHSFELIDRDRRRPYPHVIERFERLCAILGTLPGIETRGFSDLPVPAAPVKQPVRLPASARRTVSRMAEQVEWRRLLRAS